MEFNVGTLLSTVAVYAKAYHARTGKSVTDDGIKVMMGSQTWYGLVESAKFHFLPDLNVKERTLLGMPVIKAQGIDIGRVWFAMSPDHRFLEPVPTSTDANINFDIKPKSGGKVKLQAGGGSVSFGSWQVSASEGVPGYISIGGADNQTIAPNQPQPQPFTPFVPSDGWDAFDGYDWAKQAFANWAPGAIKAHPVANAQTLTNKGMNPLLHAGGHDHMIHDANGKLVLQFSTPADSLLHPAAHAMIALYQTPELNTSNLPTKGSKKYKDMTPDEVQLALKTSLAKKTLPENKIATVQAIYDTFWPDEILPDFSSYKPPGVYAVSSGGPQLSYSVDTFYEPLKEKIDKEKAVKAKKAKKGQKSKKFYTIAPDGPQPPAPEGGGISTGSVDIVAAGGGSGSSLQGLFQQTAMTKWHDMVSDEDQEKFKAAQTEAFNQAKAQVEDGWLQMPVKTGATDEAMKAMLKDANLTSTATTWTPMTYDSQAITVASAPQPKLSAEDIYGAVKKVMDQDHLKFLTHGHNPLLPPEIKPPTPIPEEDPIEGEELIDEDLLLEDDDDDDPWA